MATNKYIRGLTRQGFRIAKTGGGFGHVSLTGTTQVDLDDHQTELVLQGNRVTGAFARVSGSGATTTTIVGLSRRGFRIKNNAGTIVTVKVGSGVHTINLTKGDAIRSLLRNKRDWIFSASATQVAVRGTQNKQNGFYLKTKGTDALTSTDAGVSNVSNADTVVVGTKTYTFKTNLTEAKASGTITTSGTPSSVRATGTITTSGTGAANNDTVTVGSVTYTFKTTLTGAANEVIRDGTIDHDLTNLIAAINAGAGSGSTYGTGTVVNPDVTAGTVSVHVLTVTAKTYKAVTGNALPLSRVGAALSVSGTTLAGGTNELVNVAGTTYTFVEVLDTGVANEVLINGQDVSLTNLAAAINGTAGSGSTYGTGTVLNAFVTSSAMASHAVTITANSVGVAGNALVLTRTGSHLAVSGAGVLAGGLDSIANEVHIAGTWDLSLTNLAEAINKGANGGVDYSSATTANADATAGAVALHVLTLSAVGGGSLTVTVSTTSAVITVGQATLNDALVKVYRAITVTVDATDPFNFQQLRRHYRSWIEG